MYERSHHTFQKFLFATMSRQAQLPPRCPFQKKPASCSYQDSISPPSNESYLGHHKSPSQDSIFEEQPFWLDDLLSDSGANSGGNLHRRSACDSLTLLNGIRDSFLCLAPKDDDMGLESGCVYGPNSPRKRFLSAPSETALASVVSESIFHDPMQYIVGSSCIPGITCSDAKEDTGGSVTELTTEARIARHSGQRSRVRKLRYIADLENTVNILQGLKSELSLRVASLLQQRINLSLENSKLKQLVARMQHERLMMEAIPVKGQCQLLKKECDRLKIGLADYPRNKVKKFAGFTDYSEAAASDASWDQTLAIGKLNLS